MPVEAAVEERAWRVVVPDGREDGRRELPQQILARTAQTPPAQAAASLSAGSWSGK
jgi:hypothetical protein